MGKTYLTDINLNQNSLNNARVQNLASDPSTPVVGQTYFNTGSNKLRTYNGSTWDEYGTSTASGDVTGPASSVDSEVALFSSTTGKVIKRATGSGIATLTSGVLSTTATTGSGSVVLASSPTLVTPALGVPTSVTLTNATGLPIATGMSGLTSGTFLTATSTTAVASTKTVPTGDVVGTSDTQTLTGKTFDANGTGNTLSNVEVADFAASAIVTAAEGVGSNDNDTTIPTSAAVKAYADSVVGTADAMVFKGSIDASANPNFPSAVIGDTYKISVAGKIGGASGTNVEVGDTVIASADNAGGTLAAVGSSWIVLQTNLEAASTTLSGVVELATQAEAQAKTDTTRALTAASVADFARKYTGTIGDGSTTAIAVTHGLGSQYVTAQVFDATSNAMVECDVTLTSSTQTTFTFNTAPTTNQYRVVITG